MTYVLPNGANLHRGLSANLWTGKSLAVLEKRNPSYGWGDYDDFMPFVPSFYEVAQTDSSNGTNAAKEQAGGWILLSGTTTTAEGVQVQRGTVVTTTTSGASYAVTSARKTYYEALIELTTLGGNAFVGFGTVDDNVLETDGTVTATGSNNAIGIYLVNADVRLVSKNGTSFTATTGLAALASGIITKVGFLVDGVTSITPYVNGIALPSKKITTAASIPAGDLMAPTLTCTGVTSVATTMGVDWWAAAQVDESNFVGT